LKDRKLLIGTVAITVIVVLAAYFLFTRERERRRELDELADTGTETETVVLEDLSRGERTVNLYFYQPGSLNNQSDFLRAEERRILDVEDPMLMARQILNELIRGSEAEDPVEIGTDSEDWAPTWRTVPRETRLRQIYLLEDGTAVIDLSRQGLEQLAGGIQAEIAFIRAITRSLRENIPEIRRVRFVVEGKQQTTLAGHVSIAEAFR